MARRALQALAVVFKNKVSHHKVHVPASGNIVLNGKDTQLTDISALLTLLKKKQKKLMWPAPLVAPVVCVGVLPGDANVADTMERVKALHVSAPPPGPSAPSQAAPEPAAQDFDVLDTEATPDAYHDVDIEGGKSKSRASRSGLWQARLCACLLALAAAAGTGWSIACAFRRHGHDIVVRVFNRHGAPLTSTTRELTKTLSTC